MSKKSRIAYVGEVSIGELTRMRHRCAWRDCAEAVRVENGIPKDWRWLAVWWGPVAVPPWADGNVEDRDAVLCPQHAAALGDLLEPLPQRIGPAKGRA